MANRFPLVVDTDDGNKIKEIPVGDQLDLANSGIANLTQLSVSGALSSSTISTTGDITIGGTVNAGTAEITTLNATNINLGGESVGVPVQSDWNETDNTSLAFILNKPTVDVGVDELGDIGDVTVDLRQTGDFLQWNGISWRPQAVAASSEDIQDAIFDQNEPGSLDIQDDPPSGRGSLVLGKVKGSGDYGIITYTPPDALIKGQQDNISELVNDSQFVNEAFLTAVDSVTGKYLKANDVIGFGRITGTVNTGSGQVELTFDDSGLLTIESDTLQTVTDRGATTTTTLEADAFNQAPTSTSTNTLKDVSIETLSMLTSITGTNYDITTTNGSISATNGGITGNNGTFTNQIDAGNIRIAVNALSNTAGNNVEINGGTAKVDIQGNGLNMPSAGTLPTSPSEGDVFFSNNGLYMYVGDDGAGAADWVMIGGPGNGTGSYGMQLPAFENTDFPSLTNEGALIYDLTDSLVRVWNGTSWAAL